MVDFSQGIQGAIGGGSVGSAAGPWGTAIGAGVGLLGGLFGGGGGASENQAYKEELRKLASQYGSRQAPQTGYSDVRPQQQGLISQLQALASGSGPSAAALQMQEAMDRASAAQTSAAAGAGGRGVNQGAAYLNAANNSAAVMAQGARDTATLRAQEQLNATGQLGQVLGNTRQADEATNMANLQAKLHMLGLNDDAQLKALMSAVGVNTGPGLGTQILAGGAQALPSILQMRGAGGSSPQQAAPATGWGNFAQGFVGGGAQGGNSLWNNLANG